MSQELAWLKTISNSPTNPIYRVVDGPYRITNDVTDQYGKFTANPQGTGLPEFAGVGSPTPSMAIAPWVRGVLSTYEATPGYFQYNDWTTTAP